MTVGAVILAAGFGTRLAPLTDHTPKPLLEVGGRPVIDHLVDLIDEIDPQAPIVVVVNDQHPDAWKRWARAQRVGIEVRSNGVRRVDERLGAVADLARGVDALPPTDQVVVLAGDNLLREPLGPHVVAGEVARSALVLCRDLGNRVPPSRFGEITVDTQGRITGFREKPPDPRSPLAATCTYVLPRNKANGWLRDYLADNDPDSPGGFVAWLARREPVFARPLTGRYFDIGNHETLAQARAALAAE